MMLVDFINNDKGVRFLGLIASAVNHGLANLSPASRPANQATVIETATHFTEYIKTGQMPGRR